MRDLLTSALTYPILLLGAILSLPLGSVSAQEGAADILLFPHPNRLVMLNEYQQTPGPEERRSLTPFVPMRVIKHDFQLPDGYTHSMLVEVRGKTLHLLKDQSGTLIGSEGGSPGTRISAAFLLRDTMRVTGPKAIEIVSPDHRAPRLLEPGNVFITQFRHKRDLYIMIPGSTPTFGWILDGAAAAHGRWQRVDGATQAATGSLDSMLPRIRTRADEINGVLKGLFSEFNQMTNRQLAPPSWHVTLEGGGIVCVLRPLPFPGAFRESTAMLARDIQNMLLGTRATVAREGGRITIRDTAQ